MNTLLVPTDFSPAADNAALYAAQLARQIGASILLLHVYQLPAPMTDYPVLMVTADDLRKVSDEGLQRAADAVRTMFAAVTVETESRLGDVVTEIEEASKEANPFAVVVGTKELKGFERLLFGDTTLSLVKNCTYPVIAVPKNATLAAPQNLVLATDLLNADDIPAEEIAAIANVLNANLHVVHVEAHESKASPDELMQAFASAKASYHAIKDEDVTAGLKHYVEQNNIDLVLVLPHKHNLYERLFFKAHTEGILHSMPVPVMSIRNE